MILRHSNDHLDIHTKKRFHAKLEQTIPYIKIPTHEEEIQRIYKQQMLYTTVVRNGWFQKRETKVDIRYFLKKISIMVFRRNLWGMKTWAIGIIAICILVHSFMITQKFTSIEMSKTKDWMLLGVFYSFCFCSG